jgi:ABC-type Fe3+/spermidine/putrescine transport system ATPase subunit
MMSAGFEQPSSGDVVLDGRTVTGLSPHHRGIGVVFQNYALFPHMTVGDNIGYPLRRRKIDNASRQRQVTDVLAQVGLDGYERRYPRELSGGQQQRVALARALVFEPPVLLMDEPLGALDKKLREQLQDELRRLHKELRVTVLYVTHDQEEALALSDRIAVMSHGRIVQIGSPEEIYRRPRSMFVADFIGESNFLPGRVKETSDRACMVELDGGGVVASTSLGPLAAGVAVVVAVRPEKLNLTSAGDGADGRANRIAATLESATYLGTSIRCEVRTADGVQLLVRHPVPDAGQVVAALGSPLDLWWNVADGVALPREPDL